MTEGTVLDDTELAAAMQRREAAFLGFGEPDELPFVTAAELKASTPEEPPWIVRPYIARGAITAFAGKPKVGKSTLLWGLAGAVVTGATFLDHQLTQRPIVYLSEETSLTLQHKLPDHHDLHVLPREKAWPKPDWRSLIEKAATKALTVGSELLIVDTWAYWAGLPPEQEKDSGVVLAMMNPITEVTRHGLAVALIGHTRKGGGDDGEGLRGSSAYAGAVDIIVEMERVPDAPQQRALLALSRYPHTPGTLVVELTNGSWHTVRSDEDRQDPKTIAARSRVEADRQALLGALADGGMTRAELEDAIGAPSRQWHPILNELVVGKHIDRTGTGRKGDPYRYILRTDTAHADAQSGAETTFLVSAHPFRDAETETESEAAQQIRAETGLTPRPGETYEHWEQRNGLTEVAA